MLVKQGYTRVLTCKRPRAWAPTDTRIHEPTRANTHREIVILTAFRQQQWYRERASMLRYTYIACLMC